MFYGNNRNTKFISKILFCKRIYQTQKHAQYSIMKVQESNRQHGCHQIRPFHHRFPWAGVGHHQLPLHSSHPTDLRPQSHPMREVPALP